MKKRTKWLALICAALLFASLAGCGSQTAPAASAAPTQEASPSEAPAEEAAEAAAPQEEATAVEAEESAEVSGAAPSEPSPEDFAGDYTCTTISFGTDVVPLGEDPYTLTISGDEAVVVGIDELGTDPLKLQFENGEFYWVPPGENVRVFTLRLLDDGMVTLTFDTIPDAPVFRFDPVDAQQ